MPRRLNILMVDASANEAEVVAVELRRAGYEVAMERVQRPADLTAALDRQRWDLVLANDRLPGFTAIQVLQLLHDRARDLPLILLCDAARDPSDAMRAGARDYVVKGDTTRLVVAIERELRDQGVRLEQRRAEGQQRQEQAMEAVARLTAGVAHDFNNLLTAILAYSDSLVSQVSMQSPLRAELLEIRKAGERASALTRQLHAIGRRKASGARVVNLTAVVTGLEQRLRRTMGEHVEVRTQLASDIGAVSIDPAQFEQAILNIALNSRDAMPAGGTLTVRTANLDVQDASPRLQGTGLVPGSYVSIAITDTGCGMDASTQARAFEPFFTTKEKEAGKGSGLGLAIVYAVTRQHGGSIEIDSEPGRGTTMRMFLPRAQEQAAMEGEGEAATSTPATPAPAAAADANSTILLVEDEELVRQMAVLTLERRGYQVLVARDGTDAVACANAHAGAIDLLVADLVMPRLGGQELAQALRQTRPKMRVLYMSGYGDQVRVPTAGRDEAFLQKPYVATALADKVREALGPNTPPANRRRPEH